MIEADVTRTDRNEVVDQEETAKAIDPGVRSAKTEAAGRGNLQKEKEDTNVNENEIHRKSPKMKIVMENPRKRNHKKSAKKANSVKRLQRKKSPKKHQNAHNLMQARRKNKTRR